MGSQIPRIVGGMMALVALGSSILAQVDPVQCLIRGAACFFVGSVVGTMWNLFSKPARPKPSRPKLSVAESTSRSSPESDSPSASSPKEDAA